MKIWHIIVAVLAAVVAGGLAGSLITYKSMSSSVAEVRDTVIIERVQNFESPSAISEAPTGRTVDVPMRITKAENIDSSSVKLPEIEKTYRGSTDDGISYIAKVSGVAASLNSLTVSAPERIVSKTIVKPYNGWMLSVVGDASMQNFQQPVLFSVKAGCQLSYNINRFHAGVDFGANFSHSMQPGWGISPYVGVSVKFDLFRF